MYVPLPLDCPGTGPVVLTRILRGSSPLSWAASRSRSPPDYGVSSDRGHWKDPRLVLSFLTVLQRPALLRREEIRLPELLLEWLTCCAAATRAPSTPHHRPHPPSPPAIIHTAPSYLPRPRVGATLPLSHMSNITLPLSDTIYQI
ncbi:unnamed protein product, partial [Nezara viridula]